MASTQSDKKKYMVLRSVRHQLASDHHIISCEVQNPDDTESTLLYRISPPIEELIVDRADSFLIPCVLRAMKEGWNLKVEAPISERLAANLSDIAFIYAIQLSLAAPREIAFAQVEPDPLDGIGGMTGFSGGIDSFHTLKRHYLDDNWSNRKLSYLLHSNVGANRKEGDESSYARARGLAKQVGLPLIRVESNLNEYLPFSFQETHTARNTSAAHLFGSIISTFYYSSGFDYREVGVFPTNDNAYADPILLPLFATNSLDIVSAGSRLTRVEKTEELAHLKIVQENLDVCADSFYRKRGSFINCSKCWKCMRTLVVLDAMGVIEEFAHVFDLSLYKRELKPYLGYLATSKLCLDREAREFAASKGLRPSMTWATLAHLNAVLPQTLTKSLKKRLRGNL